MKRVIPAVLIAMSLMGCVAIISPAKSRMFFVQASEFELTANSEDTVNYFLVLGVNKIKDKPYYLDIFFQNPCNKKKPIRVDTILEAGQDKVIVRSPGLDCVKPNRYYRIVVKTYDSPEKKKRVDTLVQKTYSLVNSKKLQKNLGVNNYYVR